MVIGVGRGPIPSLRGFCGPPHTSSDLPADLATGVLRLRQTLCAVSRGLGQAVIEARFNCPAQAPMYVLRRGELPRIGAEDFNRLTMQAAW